MTAKSDLSFGMVLLALMPATVPSQVIDTMTIRQDTYFLSHDLLLGRGTGTEGERVAAHYIAARCEGLGLEPVGADWVHPFELVQTSYTEPPRIEISGAGGTRVLGPDVLVDLKPFSGTRAGEVRVYETGDEALANDVAGQFVVVPAPARPRTLPDSLLARGAAGVVLAASTDDLFDLYRASRGTSRLSLAPPSADLPVVVVGPNTLRGLLESVADGSLQMTMSAAPSVSRIQSSNVVCLLPGRDRSERGSILGLSAHFDHLGIGLPQGTDSIYNGFSDNAAGVAMLLAIAESIAARGGLRHDLALLFFSGEERGLLGSYHMSRNPPWEGELVGLVNIDAGAPPAPPIAWEVVGGNQNRVGEIAMEVGRRRGWQVRSSGIRPNSDYYPFSLTGVPTTFLIPGARPYEGMSSAESDSLFSAWDAYHRVSDEWSESFPFSGVQRYAEFARDVLIAVDQE